MQENSLKTKSIPSFVSSTDWQKTIEHILSEAKKRGASATEVTANDTSGFSVNVRLGDVETVEFTRDKGIVITVYFGQQKGSASTTDTNPQALTAAVNAACDIAKVTSIDDCAGLADKKLLAFDYPDLDLYHPWQIIPE